MKDRLEAIKAAALAKINEADVLTSLNDVKVSVLGKKGELTQVLKGMKDVAPEDRPKVGQMVNEARQAIEIALEEKSKKINQSLRAEKMKRETTLPFRESRRSMDTDIRIRSLLKIWNVSSSVWAMRS